MKKLIPLFCLGLVLGGASYAHAEEEQVMNGGRLLTDAQLQQIRDDLDNKKFDVSHSINRSFTKTPGEYYERAPSRNMEYIEHESPDEGAAEVSDSNE